MMKAPRDLINNIFLAKISSEYSQDDRVYAIACFFDPCKLTISVNICFNFFYKKGKFFTMIRF
ncbi:hypothetical protein F518_02639 [Serratia marcescens VGH107]|nr:hypothetical protein F518_02639 [Serratia marcescens VGH107]